jgi:3-oxoacyl-[acyl-carrier protein] reductase
VLVKNEMNLELNNKKVLITGASRGIGLAIAKGFLYEKSRTCIVSRGSKSLSDSEQELKREFGSKNIFALKCDCAKFKSLEGLRDDLDSKWGGLDIVVVNVGDGRSVADSLPSNDDWKRTWDNNFESALHTARTFLPMLEKSKGVLLFISSIAGMEAFGAPTDYSTAKAAIIALSKNLARKLAPNIRVNVVAPGNVYFEGGSWDEKIKGNKEQVEKTIKTSVPMKRFAEPEEIADAVLFLCSDRAKFITGASLVVDGGQSVGLM